MINIIYLNDGIHFKDNVLDLLALNHEREQLRLLTREPQLAIYVSEGVHLATKWAKNNPTPSTIELRRQDSIKWEFDFQSAFRCA